MCYSWLPDCAAEVGKKIIHLKMGCMSYIQEMNLITIYLTAPITNDPFETLLLYEYIIYYKRI